MMGCLITIVV